MSQTKRRNPTPTIKPRQTEPVRTILKHAKGVNALHEASHAVIAARLDTPGFESVDLKIRTRETHPDCGLPAGFLSVGFTKIVWPDIITRGCAWSHALGAVAPGVTSQILSYPDEANSSDLTELRTIANHHLGIDPEELLRVVWRLTGGLIQNACVFAALINTAVNLLRRTELSADEVRAILKDMQAISPQSALSLSSEIQKLIRDADLIQNHDRAVPKLVARRRGRT
jgi:hypothetical protein